LHINEVGTKMFLTGFKVIIFLLKDFKAGSEPA